MTHEPGDVSEFSTTSTPSCRSCPRVLLATAGATSPPASPLQRMSGSTKAVSREPTTCCTPSWRSRVRLVLLPAVENMVPCKALVICMVRKQSSSSRRKGVGGWGYFMLEHGSKPGVMIYDYLS